MDESRRTQIEIAARAASVRRKLDSRRGVLTRSGLENLENIVLTTRKIFKDSLLLQIAQKYIQRGDQLLLIKLGSVPDI